VPTPTYATTCYSWRRLRGDTAENTAWEEQDRVHKFELLLRRWRPHSCDLR
jgi:hypothetical protein